MSRAARIALIVLIVLLAENVLILTTPYAIQPLVGWREQGTTAAEFEALREIRSYLAEVLIRQIGYMVLSIVVVRFFGSAGAAVLCLVIVGQCMLLPLAASGLSGPTFRSLGKWHALLTYLSAALAGAGIARYLRQKQVTRI